MKKQKTDKAVQRAAESKSKLTGKPQKVAQNMHTKAPKNFKR